MLFQRDKRTTLGYVLRRCIATLFLLVYVFGVGIIVKMSETQQKKPDLGLLEEDDEFEEFPAEGPLDVGKFGGLTFTG